MAASLNKVMLIGYLGDEPKVERLQSGAVKATLSLATTKKGYTTQSGSVIPDRTEWHRVVYWSKPAEVCERFLHKGSCIYSEGELTTRSWDDADGKNHYVTEINGNVLQLLDKRQGEGSGQQAGQNAPQRAANAPRDQSSAPSQSPAPSCDQATGEVLGRDDANDDLPF